MFRLFGVCFHTFISCRFIVVLDGSQCQYIDIDKTDFYFVRLGNLTFNIFLLVKYMMLYMYVI